MSGSSQAFLTSYSKLQECMRRPLCKKKQKAYEEYVSKTLKQQGPIVDARMECMLEHCSDALLELIQHWKKAIIEDIKQKQKELKQSNQTKEDKQYLQDYLAYQQKKLTILKQVKGKVTLEQAKALLLEY